MTRSEVVADNGTEEIDSTSLRYRIAALPHPPPLRVLRRLKTHFPALPHGCTPPPTSTASNPPFAPLSPLPTLHQARPNMTRSEVVADNGTEEIDSIRTSYGTFLETAQKYDAHHDFFDEDEKKQQGGHRYATVLMYLTDGFSGGETVFPDSEKDKQEKDDTWSDCGKQGVAAKPVKGDALLFFSLKPSAEPDLASLHAGCPVLAGEKWSATKWIHVRSFEEEEDDGDEGNEGGDPSKKSHPPGACVDESEHCPLWAKAGECEKNPGYMHSSCARSCGKCSVLAAAA
ncbi:unnamed protein product [Closterium sp. Yama58-4]|nr:unnamed protein product [Closterium sp. Yama58-4]